jgi:AraC-like DNA-binding protein
VIVKNACPQGSVLYILRVHDMTSARRAIHQGFLPTQGKSRAFVWKYSPVNWGRRPRHFHIEPELNLIASGQASFGIGETVVRVSQGDLLGFPAAQDHVLLDASPDLYLFAIGMQPQFSTEILRGEADQVMIPLHLHLTQDDFRTLVNRASAIVDREGADQPCAELWGHAQWLGKRCSARPMAAMHVLTRRALSAVNQAPGLELQSLSARLRTADSEISRYFHRDVGMTFAHYRARLRLLRLISLMEEGKTTLGSAAEVSGFGSYSQCHRIFQAELGCSPRRFFQAGLREQMQQAYDP